MHQMQIHNIHVVSKQMEKNIYCGVLMIFRLWSTFDVEWEADTGVNFILAMTPTLMVTFDPYTLLCWLTVKERSEVKSNCITLFGIYILLLNINKKNRHRSNINGDIGHFCWCEFWSLYLFTLKRRSEVKSNCSNVFCIPTFLCYDNTNRPTSNIYGDIGHFI